MFNAIWEAIFAVDVEDEGHCRLILINQAFCNMTGLAAEEIRGKLLNEIVFGPFLMITLEKCREVIQTIMAVQWKTTSDYQERKMTWVISISPVFDDEGRCTSLIGPIHDISEQKLATEVTKKLNEDQE